MRLMNGLNFYKILNLNPHVQAVTGRFVKKNMEMELIIN